MKSTLIAYLLFIYLSSSFIFTNAQTGVFTFSSDDKLLPNTQMKGLVQIKNDLVMLNQSSDIKYEFSVIDIIKAESNGKVKNKTTINVDNLHNLIAVQLADEKINVFGNSYLNNNYQPFQIALNSNFETLSDNKLPQVYSTLISDVISQDDFFMILYSKVGKNELYNISLNKIKSNNASVIWLRKISSENNEEADKIVTSSNGSFYVLGKKYNDAVTEFVPVIYKINSNGDQIWKKAIDVPANFNKQSFVITNNNQLIYWCSYTKTQTGYSETRLIKLSEDGEPIHDNNISDFNTNGIIGLSDQKFLLYGSTFKVDQKQVVTKGKYVFINKQLSDIFAKELDENDKPDVNLEGSYKTSSDFNCAMQLNDGKVAIGGKIFMPSENSNDKHNSSLLLIINSDGSYEK